MVVQIKTTKTSVSDHSALGVFGYWMVLVVAIAFSAPLWAAVTAEVDRNQIYSHETLSLTVVVSGDENGEPDLSALAHAFDVIGQSQSNSFSYINGRMESRRSWMITLAPKSEGRLQIPPIAVGQRQTQPIEIRVLPPSASDDQSQAADIFIEVEVEPKTAYVQSQIAYTVRIFYATELTGGRLSELTLDNAMVERLGDDHAYQRMQDGRRFNVIERRYAIFPQSSGMLEVPAMVFDGSVAAPSQRRSRDPFFDPFGLRATKKVRLKSDAYTIDVKPRPAAAQAQWWLPARDLQLVEQWSEEPPTFRVGEPVTRTVTMQATGLTAAQLPPLPVIQSPDIKAYPDQPVTQNGGNGAWLIGARQEKIALVPAQAGEFTLPAIEVRWWDTAADRERVARLPERVIDVLPGEVTAAPETTVAAEPVRVMDAIPPTEPPSAGVGYWPWLAAFFGCAWLVTLGVLIQQRRPGDPLADRAHRADQQSGQRPAAARKAVQQACDTNDAKATRDALLNWAMINPAWSSVRSLGELAACINDEKATQAIRELDQRLYAQTLDDWSGSACWQAVSPVLQQVKRQKLSGHAGGLPALYPNT